MNIRDFEYLIAIDELKSFSKASNKCFISQPALSQQIKKIEQQFGFNIFERSNKALITTQKGQKIIQYAKAILNNFAKMQEIKNSEQNIKIALIPTICPYLLPLISKNLHRILPDVKFYFLESKTEDLLKQLKNGEIDLGIIAYFSNIIDNKLAYLKLYDEEFLLALPKESQLSEKDFPQIMHDRELILLEEGNCMSDNIREICSIYNQTSFSSFYATNIETVKNMIKINNGAGLLPKLSCLAEKDLKLVSFKERKTREIGIIMRRSSDYDNLLDIISTVVKDSLKGLVIF